jgi:hypothetical protein
VLIMLSCCGKYAHTSALDIDEVHVVGSGVDHGPEGQLVGDLTMEPDVLISWEEPSKLGANEANDVAEHGDEDETAIECQYETGTTGRPHGPGQGVQARKLFIGGLLKEKSITSSWSIDHELYLRVPTVSEEEQMEAIEDDVKGKTPWSEKLPVEPRLAHLVGCIDVAI